MLPDLCRRGGARRPGQPHAADEARPRNATSFGPNRSNVPFPRFRPPTDVATSEVLALLAPGAPLLACPVGSIPLERAQGPLDLRTNPPTFLGDRVALREQHLTVFCRC